jgi:hypothetical protein
MHTLVGIHQQLGGQDHQDMFLFTGLLGHMLLVLQYIKMGAHGQ